jgi:threonine dehydratase
MQPPTLKDVYDARERVYEVVRPTPLMRHPLLSLETGLDVRVKHENHNPTGAFKVRGGLNLIAALSREERRGVITATTGNHGQSIALACQRQSVPCTIVTPLGNNPEKNLAMRALGADVIEFGRDFDEARERVEQMRHERRLRYVHSANEPMLIAGVATYALEIFDDWPDVDVILVPIGGGSGACGCSIVRSAVGSRARVIGVQAVRADAFARSWHGPARVVGQAQTFAEGLATRTTFDLTFGLLKSALDDVVTLEESELEQGMSAALRCTHNLAEGAGAAALAAARKVNVPAGARIVCVMTGGNADERTLRRALS